MTTEHDAIGYAVILETDYYGPSTKRSILSQHDTKAEAETALAALDTGQPRELGHNVSGERERVVPILAEYDEYPDYDALDSICDVDTVAVREWEALPTEEQERYRGKTWRDQMADWLEDAEVYQRICDIALNEAGEIDLLLAPGEQYRNLLICVA